MAVSLAASISKFGWRLIVWLLLVLPVLAAYFRPWLGLVVLVLTSAIEIWLSWNWHAFRCSQFVIASSSPLAEDVNRNSGASRTKALIGIHEWHQFRIRWRLFRIAAFTATAVAMSLVLAPFVGLLHRCVTSVTASVFLVLGLVLYGAAGALFVSLRMFVEPFNLIPWRDQTNATQGAMSFFLRVLLIKKKDETPGRAIVPSVVVVIAFTLSLGGLASASPQLNSSLRPHGSQSQVQQTDPTTSTTPTTPATSTTSTNPAGSTTPTTSAFASTTTTTTKPSTAVNCDTVGADLASNLTVVGGAVSEEYANNATTLQCLSVSTNGTPVVTSWGDLNAVQFVQSDGQQTGSIVYDEAGNTATVLSNETSFTQSAQGQSALLYVTDIGVVHGAQVRLGVLADGGCMLGLRPNSDATWTIIPPSEAPAALSVFLGVGEVGRPVGEGVFKFSYGRPSISVTVGSDKKVTVKGGDPKLDTAAQLAHECPTISTITSAQLSGPPA